jgi:hypothetical protein
MQEKTTKIDLEMKMKRSRKVEMTFHGYQYMSDGPIRDGKVDVKSLRMSSQIRTRTIVSLRRNHVHELWEGTPCASEEAGNEKARWCQQLRWVWLSQKECCWTQP